LLYPDNPHALQAELKTSQMDILTLMESGDEIAAQDLIDKMITDFNDHPDLPQAVFRIGEEYFYTHQYQKAIDVWKLVLDNYPGRGPDVIPYLLATCYKRLEEYPTAIAYYKQVLDQYPNSQYAERAPHNLGVLHRWRGEYEEAVYWFQKQPELYSDELLSDWSLYARGVIHLQNFNQPDRALELFTQYLREFPAGQSADVVPCNLAECCARLGDTPTAVKILQDALLKYGSQSIGEDYRRKLAVLEKGGAN